MRFIKRLAVLCATLCLLFTGMQSAANVAFAEGKTATDVLEDLSRDKSFNPDNYPTKTDDYSLQIIQLAESVDTIGL